MIWTGCAPIWRAVFPHQHQQLRLQDGGSAALKDRGDRDEGIKRDTRERETDIEGGKETKKDRGQRRRYKEGYEGEGDRQTDRHRRRERNKER